MSSYYLQGIVSSYNESMQERGKCEMFFSFDLKRTFNLIEFHFFKLLHVMKIGELMVGF